MRFDRASLTHRVSEEEAVAVLLDGFGPGVATSERKPMKGYDHAIAFSREGDLIAWADFDGDLSNGWNHFESSGEPTPAFVTLARKVFPGHRAVRLDSCEDFMEVGCFDRLVGKALEIADRLHLKVQHWGDWHRGLDGRTLYLGAPSSAVRVRIYEKGPQLGLHLTDPAMAHWVRVEVVVRPKDDARYQAATVSPTGLWGFSRWTRILLAELMGVGVPRVTMVQHKVPDCDAAVSFMAKQYGSQILEYCARHALTREAFSSRLWQLIDLNERQKARARANREREVA